MTWACALHTRLYVMGNSLLKLAPKNNNPKKNSGMGLFINVFTYSQYNGMLPNFILFM